MGKFFGKRDKAAAETPAVTAEQKPAAGVEAAKPDDADPEDEEEDEDEVESEEDDDSVRAVKISEACDAAGLSNLTTHFLKSDMSVAQVTARIADFPKIKDAVAQARKLNPAISLSLATDFITAGTSLKDARANLFDILVEKQSPEIRNSHTPDNRPAGVKQDYGWGKTTAKANAKLKKD